MASCSVLPGIAFSLDLIETTQQYAVGEVLVSSFMAAFVFSVLGAQPLTIAGVTGKGSPPLHILPQFGIQVPSLFLTRQYMTSCAHNPTHPITSHSSVGCTFGLPSSIGSLLRLTVRVILEFNSPSHARR